MKYNNVSLPYPVLGINDDVFPLLEDDCIVMADPIKNAQEYIFRIELKQKNKEIEKLISEGKAEYACELECKDTYLRHCYHSSVSNFDIHVPRRSVNGRINFSCFVAAKTAIIGYSNSNFNEDYKGFKFDLDKGDLLVVFPLAYYNTNIRFDKLFAAGSFMQIVETANGIDKTWFNLEEDRILIELPHDMFVKYQSIGNNFPELIHSSLVHNALVYALSNLSDYADKGKLWADSIMQRIQSEPQLQQYDLTDMQDVFRMADQLLQDPYKRLLDAIERINESIHSDDRED